MPDARFHGINPAARMPRCSLTAFDRELDLADYLQRPTAAQISAYGPQPKPGRAVQSGRLSDAAWSEVRESFEAGQQQAAGESTSSRPRRSAGKRSHKARPR